jgi:lupus La protein
VLDLDQKILRQIEYYFGDSNFRKDKFLLAESKKDEQGYVALAQICAFNKMKTLGATEVEVVAKAVENSTIVQLSEDRTKVKRRNPLPETDDSENRTVYAKGFSAATTLEKLQEFWATHGTVLNITMRKNFDRSFKGSVLIEFALQEQADAVLQKKAEIKFEDTVLTIQPKKEWDAEKSEYQKNQKKAKSDSKRKTAEDHVKQQQGTREKYIEDLKAREVPVNTVVKVEGLPEASSVNSLKDHFNKIQPVAFVDYHKGNTHGFVRFETDCSAILDKAKEEKFQDASLTLTLLVGDDCKAHWLQTWTEIYDRKQKQNTSKGHRMKKQRR